VLCSSRRTWAENTISFPCGGQLPQVKLSAIPQGVICRSSLPSSLTVKNDWDRSGGGP
jgi:hypothetical protein